MLCFGTKQGVLKMVMLYVTWPDSEDFFFNGSFPDKEAAESFGEEYVKVNPGTEYEVIEG